MQWVVHHELHNVHSHMVPFRVLCAVRTQLWSCWWFRHLPIYLLWGHRVAVNMSWALFHGKMQKHSKEHPPPSLADMLGFHPWVLFYETMAHPYYSPPVLDTPSDCNITATYSQSSGMLLSINSTWNTVSVSHIIPYSKNVHWVQLFVIFADRSSSAEKMD